MSKSISVNLNETALNLIAIVRDNLFPESMEYNPNTDQFLLSSVTEGSIFTTNEFAIQTVGLIDTQNKCENINATDIVPIFGSNNSDLLFADTGDLIFGGNDGNDLLL
ncbi:MAG: hypothetical protein SWZ49_17935 [Cyanobacteriota bacterium]|nr:hypothetical protein [Cyanobacteriota bacterium]